MSTPQEPGYFEKLETLLQRYINDRLLLIKLQTAEKSAKIGSITVLFIVLTVLAFFILFFISLMGGYFFAEVTGSLFYGFSIITGFYILLLVILLAIRKKYLMPMLTNAIIKIVLEKNNDEDEPAAPINS